MVKKVLIVIMGGALALGLTTLAASAGGHGAGGMVVRHGGGHMAWGGGYKVAHGGGFPGHGGEARVRVGGGSLGAYGTRGPFYGHVNTALRNRDSRRFAGAAFERRNGYGHVNTGFGRLHPAARFALVRHRFGYGGYGGEDYGYGAGSDYAVSASGSGGAGYGSTAGGESGNDGVTRLGYADGSGGGFAEPPLNAVGYGGGPHILVATGGHGPHRTVCTCERDGGPIVYRFGVGSYY